MNGKVHNEKEIPTLYGDQILINDSIFVNKKESIKVIGNHEHYQTSLIPLNMYNHHLQDFPNYRRSPRVIKRTEEEKVAILSPPEKEKIAKGELAAIIITPLLSVASTIAVSILMPRGPYIYITIVMAVVSTTMAITKYFGDKKQREETNERKEAVYEKYLLKTRETLEEYRNNEQDAIIYHYPMIKELENQVNTFSSRIYERDRTDDDFLQVNIGYKRARSNIEVTLSENELAIEENPLLEEAKQIKEIYENIDNKPTPIDLKSAHVGLVGDKEDIHKQIKQILAQLTFFHSYHDIEIIMLYNESYKETFDYVKWYPHVRINAINVRGNIYLEKVRDQVLGSLAQILKQRRDKRDERKREGAFTPHYVIFIDDYFLIMNHSIMEYLQEETTNLGFTLVFSAKQKADLPENIHTVVMIEDTHVNRLLLNNREMVNAVVQSPQIDTVNLETMARNLSVLQHQKGVQSYIPESITFFDLYNVEKPDELHIKQRWDQSNSHKSLSVPLGVRAKDDIVKLDLHEKAHGPHGLVAGTTGSGKSEIIQSYILSLAVNFHPHEVGFLLIDYKGGGMANLFNKLPHLLGTITNLDGSESMRALASIKSELQRRQRIFNEHGVNNIIKYNKLFKSGKAKEPLPTLFLISDEFAELKKEQPEFMSELVSVARIGRTLGIKLILATQKPSGVVDDQIWSNSKFKLALKVQNESDSKEVIKTPDAAYITQAGRAYLQVGNNEIYELFQSAWSGATYLDDEAEEHNDTLVYRINDIGQAELINQDLSGGDDDEGNAVSLTQLDVTIDYIHDMYEGLNAVEVMKPWLPSLQPQIASPYIPEEVEDITNIKTIQLDLSIYQKHKHKKIIQLTS
ncbi:MAG: type VII secretion protein EssC [Coprobacillaceae bacterium]